MFGDPMTQRDALEAACKVAIDYAASKPPGFIGNLPQSMADAITAYHAALPPGDEAGLVKRLRERWANAEFGVFHDAIAALEAKDATIARLQGERDGWRENAMMQKDRYQEADLRYANEKARADKAEAQVATFAARARAALIGGDQSEAQARKSVYDALYFISGIEKGSAENGR